MMHASIKATEPKQAIPFAPEKLHAGKIAFGNFLNHVLQARKKSTKINFLSLETAGWVGVFHAKGWGSKSSRPHSKVCDCLSSLGFVRRNLGCSGNFVGMSRTLGMFKKFVQ